MSTGFNKLTIKFKTSDRAMEFAKWILKKTEEQKNLFNAIIPMPYDIAIKPMPYDIEGEEWISNNWGCKYDGGFKLEAHNSETLIISFKTRSGNCKELIDNISEDWEDCQMSLEYFNPEKNWLSRYVWNGFEATEIEKHIEDITLAQAYMIARLDEYGFRWYENKGEYSFRIKYDSVSDTFEFSIRHFEKTETSDGVIIKEIIEDVFNTMIYSEDKWNKLKSHYNQILEELNK